MLHAAVAPSLPATAVTFSVSGRFSATLPPGEKEVVVVRQNVLALYRTTDGTGNGTRTDDAHARKVSRRDAEVLSEGDDNEEQALSQETAVLELVAEVALNAPPLSAAVCKPSAPSTSTGAVGQIDVLALLFDDFHISFLQFNALRLEFDTVGLVQLDDRDTKMERCPLNPIMRVDPTGTYVAVLVRRRELFVFPVIQRVLKEEYTDPVEGTSAAALNKDREDASTTGAAATAATVKTVEKKPKVSLDAWGDEDDDESNDGEPAEDQTKEAAPVKPSDAPPTNDIPVSTTTQSQTLVMNDEVIQFGVVTKMLLADLKPVPLNVRDFQFVETAGGDPLFAFLYEKDPTWVGRVRLVEWRSRTVESNMLTCSILWIKWNSAGSGKPKPLTIGDVDNLPYNLTHLVPLPAFQQVPSAVLCVGQNTLVHVSVKNGFGAFINATGKDEVSATRSSAVVYEAAKWASSAQERSLNLVRTNLNFGNALCVVADAAESSGKGTDGNTPLHLLLVTEKEGTLVEVTLEAGGYTVASMVARIIRTGCFANTWCSLRAGGTGSSAFATSRPASPSPGHVVSRYFFGSVSGDSRVVAWEPNGAVDSLQTFVGLGPVHDVDVVDSSQRARRGTAANGSDALSASFGASIESSPFADLFHNVSIDPEPQIPLRERRAVMDLAVCSGMGSEGALCVLRQSIRDEVIRREEVNAVSVFFMENKRSVRGGGGGGEGRRKRARDGDRTADTYGAREAGSAHLMMTGNRFTILFAVRSDSVQQVRGTVLNIAARTVFAAELDWAPALLQVTETEMFVASLDGKRTRNHVVIADALPDGSDHSSFGTVKSAFLLSSRQAVLVHFEHGQVVLYFGVEGRLDAEESANGATDGAAAAKASLVTAALVMEHVTAITHWASHDALVAVQGEDLILYDHHQGTVTGRFPNFSVLPEVAVEGVPSPLVKLSERLNKNPFPVVSHLQLYDHPVSPATGGTPGRGTATLMLITTSGELLTYRMMPKDAAGPRRLLKNLHHLLDVNPEREKIETIEEKKRRLAEEKASLEKDTLSMRERSERLIPFTGIGGYDGVYVCGQHPVFLVYDEERNELVASRHQTDGAVRGFAAFRSRHVEEGYVYCCEGYVHFASMQPFGQSVGHGWWMQRVPLGVTPHHVVYSSAAHSCYVVTSTPHPFSMKRASFDVQLRFTYDEESRRTTHVEHPAVLPPLSAAHTGAPVPLNDQYEIRFFSCGDWTCTDTFRLEENEKVLSAQCIAIPRDTSMDETEASAMGPICVIATAFPLGEDVTTRGRLLLLASRHAEGENKLRLLHSEPLKGPATAVTGIEGNIAVAVGGTIRVFKYDYRTQKLETMAMLYAGAYVTKLAAFRHYLIFGDLFHSAALARFSADNHTLTVLGKDVNPFSVVQADMLYHGGSFGIVATDDQRNLAVMGYTPRVQEMAEDTTAAASKAGAAGSRRNAQAQQKKAQAKVLESLLSVDGEYRLAGGSLLKLLRFRSMHSSASPALYMTNYGEIGFLVPLSAQANLTSQFLARRLHKYVAPAAGLPSRMFLGFRQDDAKYAMRATEKLVHAPLLADLFRLDSRQRKAVAADASTQLERVLNVGATIYAETALF